MRHKKVATPERKVELKSDRDARLAREAEERTWWSGLTDVEKFVYSDLEFRATQIASMTHQPINVVRDTMVVALQKWSTRYAIDRMPQAAPTTPRRKKGI